MTDIPALPPLILKKGEERRLRAGHGWVFSNEVDTERCAFKDFAPGQAVTIVTQNGKAIGNGYVNPHSLICARLVSRDPHYVLNKSLLVHRLQVALALRERLFAEPYYRAVYGDSDGLPGLIVDRYDQVVVAQITTAGMEAVKADIVAAIEKVLRPHCLVFRNDSSSRALEGLDSYTEVALGSAPDALNVHENGAQFHAPLVEGQKTGWFYDHRANRRRLQDYVAGKRVLDMFSYLGAWGIPAAMAGASEVVCVDSSGPALEQLAANAARNGVADKVRTLRGDAFEVLQELRQEHARFDVVVLDPPAFIRRKKDIESGTEAYRRLNQHAIQVLEKDGLLVSASCSYHLARDTLRGLVLSTSRHLDRFVQLIEQGGQAPDHPVHPAIPETEYLKALFCRVLPA